MPQKFMIKILLACGVCLAPNYDVIAWAFMALQLIRIGKNEVSYKHFLKAVCLLL